MNGLNFNQIEKVLNHSAWICQHPGCATKPAGPGFKIKPSDKSIKFVRDFWSFKFIEIIDDTEIVNILSHEKNTLRLCEYHMHDFEIDLDIDPEEAEIILESIYRGMNG